MPNGSGYGVSYWYRPRPWLALEAGLDQIIRPVGSSACCEFFTSARDELYLVPFGLRFVGSVQSDRVQVTIGGGGAYVRYSPGELPDFFGFSDWGGQAVASMSVGITRSGRLRLGGTGRFYYVRNYGNATRFFTFGPDLTFSF